MTTITLYHDGCNICLSVEHAFMRAFANHPGFESVNLELDRSRSADALKMGVTRLPSLVIGDEVLRIQDHSDIEHYMPVKASA
jgi:hypothetical protein